MTSRTDDAATVGAKDPDSDPAAGLQQPLKAPVLDGAVGDQEGGHLDRTAEDFRENAVVDATLERIEQITPTVKLLTLRLDDEADC